ncbi:MAG: transporter [Acidobacteria bacterium]|nr:transporter [Acidobacteriota bacterium]
MGTVSVSQSQTPAPAQAEEESPIQDNGFLVEEAYNQEDGVVQHASLLNYFRDSKDWNYGFTQEWPLPFDWRHQFSYTLSAVRPGALPDDGPGFGDVALNYRYQLVGSGKDRVAVAPRLSLFLPSGDSRQGRGFGGTGYQVNLPLSIQHNKWIVSHWNVGGTLVPDARNLAGDQARTTGFNFGKSLILLAHPNLNLMLETIWTGQQAVAGPGRTDSGHALFISPGVRWAHNFESGLQIVPGVALAFGAGPSKDEKILVFYLSFEHPFKSAD